MRLIYFEDPNGNVGDALNPWLWPRMLNYDFDEDDDSGFLAIGSILAQRYIRQTSRGIVFGSGVRHSEKTPVIDPSRWTIQFVRGPLSSRALGGAPYITDPALLSPLIYKEGRFAQGFTKGNEIGYVRYFKSPRSHAKSICSRLGLKEIDPTLPPDAFMEAMEQCHLIVTEAMHGAILADSFRIPWIGVRAYSDVIEGRVAGFKWEDWLRSMEIDPSAAPRSRIFSYAPATFRSKLLKPVSVDKMTRIIETALNNNQGALSKDSVWRDKQENLMSQVDHLKLILSR
jgi:succinoglycan biosynthesis protein ExoV